MPLYVVHPGVDLTLELYVSDQLEAAVAVQWERVRDKEVRKTYTQALERRLEDLLKDCLDWDLKPPTPAQVSFATVLAMRLSINVPFEALNSRFHMAMFLEEHGAKARAPKAGADTDRRVGSGVLSQGTKPRKKSDASGADFGDPSNAGSPASLE